MLLERRVIMVLAGGGVDVVLGEGVGVVTTEGEVVVDGSGVTADVVISGTVGVVCYGIEVWSG